MELVTSIVTSVSELRGIVSEWNDLLGSCEADTIFLTPEWVFTWIETCDESPELFFITVHQDDRLIGLAPFYLTKIKFFGLLSFSCLRVAADQNTSSEYQDVLIHRDYKTPVINAIADELSLHSKRFSFSWIPFSDGEQGAAERFTNLFKTLFYEVRTRNFDYFTVDLPRTKDDFDTQLTSKQRNNIRRYKQQREEGSEVEVVNLAEAVSVDEVFNILTTLHAERWSAKGDPGAFVRKPAFSRFTKAFLDVAANKGWLFALCLYKDNSPIAIRFGYIYKDVVYEIQGGFSPTLGGSGIVSIDLSIEHAIAHGVNEYDFLASSGGYKHRFQARNKPGMSIFAARRRPLNRLLLNFFWPTGRLVQQS